MAAGSAQSVAHRGGMDVSLYNPVVDKDVRVLVMRLNVTIPDDNFFKKGGILLFFMKSLKDGQGATKLKLIGQPIQQNPPALIARPGDVLTLWHTGEKKQAVQDCQTIALAAQLKFEEYDVNTPNGLAKFNLRMANRSSRKVEDDPRSRRDVSSARLAVGGRHAVVRATARIVHVGTNHRRRHALRFQNYRSSRRSEVTGKVKSPVVVFRSTQQQTIGCLRSPPRGFGVLSFLVFLYI